MKRLARLFRLLAAHGLTPYLVLGYCLCLAFLFAWSVTSPPAVVASIARLAPFVLVYAAGGVHLACCTILFWPAVRRRISLASPGGEAIALPGVGTATLAVEARRAGLRVRWLDGDRSRAVLYRHRFSPVGTTVFHAALLLLVPAVFLSRATRFRGDAWIVEGHPFDGTRAEYTRVEPPDAFAERAPEVHFQVESIAATFWGDVLFFTDLRALLDTGAGAEWVTLPQPIRLGGADVSIHGFNYTPSYTVTDPDGAVIDEGDLKLLLFPPGREDSFVIPGLPYRYWVRLYPAHGYALVDPRLHVAVTLGKRLLDHRWLRLGEPIDIDGYRLAFPRILSAGEIMVHRDLGAPLLWLALILGVGGTALRVGFPSVRVWVELGEPTRGIIRADAFAEGRAAALLRRWGHVR